MRLRRRPGGPSARGLRRLLVAASALCLAVALLIPAGAVADGDPGSDVLLAQNLFAGSDSGISVAQQLALTRLLDATATAGAPVRVAIISHADDLGAVTQVWEQPQVYAAYLGDELSDAYTGRLLVVMPAGFGVYYRGTRVTSAYAALSHTAVPATSDPARMVAAATAATQALERAAGVSAARLVQAAAGPQAPAGAAPAPSSTAGAVPAPIDRRAGSGGASTVVVLLVLIAALTAVFWLPPLWRRRRHFPGVLRFLAGALRPLAPDDPRGLVRAGLGFGTGAAALLVLAIVIHASGTHTALVSNLQNNPNIDPGSPLTPARPAPNFDLVDETGHDVSLSQYRGKAVILSFIDDECETVCPLTTTAMLDAKRSLGTAGKDVVLLGVDANWKSTLVEDVQNYTDFHGMAGQWHFLTGSLPQLNQVWSDYHLNELKIIEKEHGNTNVIDHVIATFVIDPEGRLRTEYQTVSSYAAIPQLGQLLAQNVSRLLPSHPTVDTHLSYSEVQGTAPTTAVTLPRVGGGGVQLGPGHPHVYVFFDTWDKQTTPIAGELDELNAYAQEARRDGLPSPVAVDEASVEPSPQALPEFLASLPQRLDYPVLIDKTGRVADGYDVEGEPWFIATSPGGQLAWSLETYTSSWPSNATIARYARAALGADGGSAPTSAAVKRELAGSPQPLAALHSQAAQTLGGGMGALEARIRALRGYPVVVNVWYSTCTPCEKEAPLLARASAQFGRRVGFLGADIADSPSQASVFMRQNRLSYPTYLAPSTSFGPLLVGGLEDTPTTIYLNAAGKVVHEAQGEYTSQGVLDQDINTYALTG